MKKILVTGSGGFIFSNFIRKALYNKSEYTFVSIDVCNGKNVLNNIYANKGHKFYIGDVADNHFIDVIFEIEKPDIVIHGAANNSNNSKELIHSNILGTQNILEACSKWSIEKLIYISSDKVYAPSELLSATETSMLEPKNMYASTKLAGEFLVKISKIPYTILRLGNCYGQRQQTYNFIPQVISSLLDNKELTIAVNGTQLNEWTYIEDICSGIMTVLENNYNSTNQIYNVSSGCEFSYMEVFNEICNIFERGYDLIKFVEPSMSELHRYATNSNKLKSLGWKPSFKLKTGLHQTCSWYEKNPWYLRTN